MKSRISLATILLALTSTALGTPLVGHDVEGPAPKTSRDTNGIINVPLTDWIKNNHTDLQWYMTVSVGTPPQNFTVLIDTGSNILLLAQNNCTSCSASQRKFDPSQSTTFAWSPLGVLDLSYGTGGDTLPLTAPEAVQCNVATDAVSVQGLTAPSLGFALCWDEGETLSSQPGIDGILGLSLNVTTDPDWPQTLQWALLDAGLLASGVLGLYTPSGEVDGAQLTLGGVDDTKFDGDLAWLPLNLSGHTTWTVDMQTVFVNGQQLMVPSTDDGGSSRNSSSTSPYPQSLVQVLDSGTSFLMAPDNATAAAVYAQVSPKIRQIDAAGTWGCACEDMDALVGSGAAELTFLLGPGGEGDSPLNVTVPSRVFNLGPYPGLPGVCQAVLNNWADGVSYGGVALWTLGSPLLKNYYTAWDGLGQQVGWAPLKGSGVNVTATTTTVQSATPSSEHGVC